jgi:hypothetical protein
LPCICAAGGGKAGAALATLGQLHGLAAGTARRAAAALPGPTPQQLRAFAAALFSPFEAQLTRCCLLPAHQSWRQTHDRSSSKSMLLTYHMRRRGL